MPLKTHRWNFWVCGSEAALYITATKIMGPATLIPFLFNRLGIDPMWMGLFSLGGVIVALGAPIGTAMGGGRQWKLPYCIKTGVLQRLPFLAVPLGAMFFFSSSRFMLYLLVASWMASNFFGGLGFPVFQVVITNGVREQWWGRMMSLRNVLAAIIGLAASALVWWVNRRFEAPTNYVVLGWVGVSLLGLSLYVVTRIREVPMARELPHGLGALTDTLRGIVAIIRKDSRVRWILVGRTLRSAGFLVGAYMTPVFILRCNLTDADMWLPVILLTIGGIVGHAVAGWFVDHFGAKPALVLSSLSVAASALLLSQATSRTGFAIVFLLGPIGGGLLANAWPVLILKLAPMEKRPVYATTLSLVAIPGGLVIVLGMILVHLTGFTFVFYASAVGAVMAALVFFLKLPNIRQAPRS